MLDKRCTMMSDPNLDSILQSCRYCPFGIDIDEGLIWFAETTREVYRDAAFLTPDRAQLSEECYGLSFGDVLLRDLSVPIGGAPCHWIFISALCCSTLLARMLDLLPGCLVVKEPSLLGQLAMLRYRPGLHEAAAKREEIWKNWSMLGIRLLTRTFDSSEIVIIKAADVCNTLGDVILGSAPRSKIVLLSTALRTFIISVLKHEDRRNWARRRARFWRSTLTLFPPLNEVDPSSLSDASQTAYVWLVTRALWSQLRKEADPRRLLAMDGQEISDAPSSALKKVAEFFGLSFNAHHIEEAVSARVINRHAKWPHRAYDADARKNDLAAWEARFGDEADRAIAWATPIQKQLRAL